MYKDSAYLTGNTTLHNYKGQSVNAMYYYRLQINWVFKKKKIREIIAVHSESRENHINTVRQIERLLMLNNAVYIVTTMAYIVNN
jgi:hypothetical protein